jgi:hypothetical protein
MNAIDICVTNVIPWAVTIFLLFFAIRILYWLWKDVDRA